MALSTDRIGDIDSLGIAEKLLQKGIHVIIVDVDNDVNNHQVLGHYISCNILHVQCSSEDTEVEIASWHAELLSYVDVPVMDIHSKQKQQKRISVL